MDKGRFNRVKLTVEAVKYEKVNSTTVCNITFSFNAIPIVSAIMKDHHAKCVFEDNTYYDSNLKNNNYMRAFIEARGVATCHEKDKFDKKIGRKIAYSKAFLEGYRKFYHIIDISTEALYNKCSDLAYNRYDLKAIIDAEKSYLDKLRNCEK